VPRRPDFFCRESALLALSPHMKVFSGVASAIHQLTAMEVLPGGSLNGPLKFSFIQAESGASKLSDNSIAQRLAVARQMIEKPESGNSIAEVLPMLKQIEDDSILAR